MVTRTVTEVYTDPKTEGLFDNSFHALMKCVAWNTGSALMVACSPTWHEDGTVYLNAFEKH